MFSSFNLISLQKWFHKSKNQINPKDQSLKSKKPILKIKQTLKITFPYHKTLKSQFLNPTKLKKFQNPKFPSPNQKFPSPNQKTLKSQFLTLSRF